MAVGRKGPELTIDALAGWVKDGRDAEAALAERLLSEALTEVRWREIDFATRPKGHPVKVKIAQQLRWQTPMSRQRIADRLRMGSASYVSSLLSSVDSKL
jgi:hypothetical protein